MGRSIRTPHAKEIHLLLDQFQVSLAVSNLFIYNIFFNELICCNDNTLLPLGSQFLGKIQISPGQNIPSLTSIVIFMTLNMHENT